ncbi:hypothetical protein [Brenneria corticis]|uniref:hypothetical protein n=1 Tax=Brenneria corticis TaxID=2173106 RepID=UPI00143D3933|nr:hypothetical protein [Brenneria sp. CFCC 11842]
MNQQDILVQNPAAQRFQQLGTAFSLDIAPGAGHGIDERMLNHALARHRQSEA